MPYTLAMAGIEIAQDGVAEVSMTDARAQLTRLIRGVREGHPAGAFTERGERTAYVVTPDAYEQARRVAAALREATEAPLGADAVLTLDDGTELVIEVKSHKRPGGR